jgi:antitoxin component of RelBE/YafQ-DinJ toxin-antitoxin module
VAKLKNMKIKLEPVQRPVIQNYHLHIRISYEEHERAKEIAFEHNITVSELVRLLLSKV